MSSNKSFLSPRGNYRQLIVYQKAECIYDITFHFAHRFLEKGDRTIDQMVQAARSGKQNIAEGCAASTTSRETEIKLVNVAKASLQELLIDYEDFLRVRNLSQWNSNDQRYQQTRTVTAKHNDSAYYREAISKRSAETVANIAITLIHQTDTMLGRLIETLKKQFIQQGGIREEMTRARLSYRNNLRKDNQDS
ncbi:MAG: four helix bundle suffix domain-containing protein [Prevotella sp.]|nr:four helix bundle suffix domain-containing protein [Prevotella sp.]